LEFLEILDLIHNIIATGYLAAFLLVSVVSFEVYLRYKTPFALSFASGGVFLTVREIGHSFIPTFPVDISTVLKIIAYILFIFAFIYSEEAARIRVGAGATATAAVVPTGAFEWYMYRSYEVIPTILSIILCFLAIRSYWKERSRRKALLAFAFDCAVVYQFFLIYSVRYNTEWVIAHAFKAMAAFFLSYAVITIWREPFPAEAFSKMFIVSKPVPIPELPRNVFSRQVGLEHKQLLGKKILSEFDPASNYETHVKDFVDECLANGEQVILFTHRGGSIYTLLRSKAGVRFFCLSPRVPEPTATREYELLLPIDSTLMVDALNKVIEANPQIRFSLLFDNLSELILAMGFQKTHAFIKHASELMPSDSIVLFLFNPRAHDEKVKSIFEAASDILITYDSKGVKLIKGAFS